MYECSNIDHATNFSFALAFSQRSARDLDGDGLANTNEMTIGTNHELADSDTDGMKDGYEVECGLNPAVDDAASDKDGDGASNLAEYIAGTSADESTSIFQVASDYQPGESMFIQTGSYPNRLYQIYFADSAGGFSPDLVWHPFNNTNNSIGSWFETNTAESTFTFEDDYSDQTTDEAPSHTRFYLIKVLSMD